MGMTDNTGVQIFTDEAWAVKAGTIEYRRGGGIVYRS
jgi:hypothetical protein